jgi:hypothetical protein
MPAPPLGDRAGEPPLVTLNAPIAAIPARVSKTYTS